MSKNIFQVVKEGDLYFYKWSDSPIINVTREEVNEDNFINVEDIDCFTNYLCLNKFDLKAAAKEYILQIRNDNEEKILREKFKSILNIDYKNKRYLFFGGIYNLHFSSGIEEIVLYNDSEYLPNIMIKLSNGVTIMLDKDCQIEKDCSYSEEQKERIYIFNYVEVCLGYIREI